MNVSLVYQHPIPGSISFWYDWSMEVVNGQTKTSTGLEESSMQEEGLQHSVQKEMYG